MTLIYLASKSKINEPSPLFLPTSGTRVDDDDDDDDDEDDFLEQLME
jgi:hypothetical protein